MFGYLTFNVKYYMLSRIFYKKNQMRVGHFSIITGAVKLYSAKSVQDSTQVLRSYLLWRPCCIATCENFYKSVIHWISVTLYIAIFYSSTNTVDLITCSNISRKEMHFFYALPRMVSNLDTPYHERTSYLTSYVFDSCNDLHIS